MKFIKQLLRLLMTSLALTKLQALSINDCLAHAWLFVGADLNAKLQLANTFSHWLFCNQTCGQCKNCSLIASGTHPDFCTITVQEDAATITVDQIRGLTKFVTGKPQIGCKKIAIIYPAEKLLDQAANALLKVLEEPGPDTILILIAEHANVLLKTIVSRCQQLRVTDNASIPEEYAAVSNVIMNDLQQLLTNRITAVELAERWVKQWPNEVLYWFELALGDLIKSRYIQDSALLNNPVQDKILQALNQQITSAKLWAMVDNLKQARYWLGRGQKPNLQLILEDCLI